MSATYAPTAAAALDAALAPVITIDGPTASGKGTVAQAVADALGWQVLDSGALYRLTALAITRQGMDPDDVDAVAAVAAQLPVRFDAGEIWLDDTPVGQAIRAEAIGNLASRVAALPAVRAALLSRQRDFRQWPGLVADGRDMGTVVFPDAPLKVFLLASAEARAERRYKQLNEKGVSVKLDELLADLRARDARDMGRTAAPLKAAPDALTLDSSALSIDATVQTVLEWYRSRSHQA